MRIGLIAPPWAPIPPSLYGGVEVVVDLLARGYQAAGHDVLLCTTGDSTCPVPRMSVIAVSEGDRIHEIEPELRHVIHSYDAAQGCDVVHDHTLLGPLYAARFPALRVVTTIHSPLGEEYVDLYRRVASDGCGLIAISEAQRRPTPDIPIARVIHHGIDASNFPFGTGGEYVLFLGRLDPDKGAARAVAAARKAGVPLLLAGKMRSHGERAYFDEFVKPHMGSDVQYLGEVSHEEKLRLLSGARALLFPIAWNEPFGMVMIEAMACGTPVLASPMGAVPEVVNDGVTGFLCPDEDTLAEAIGKVDQLDRRKCRAAVEGYFSADRMVMDHLTLFEALAGR